MPPLVVLGEGVFVAKCAYRKRRYEVVKASRRYLPVDEAAMREGYEITIAAP